MVKYKWVRLDVETYMQLRFLKGVTLSSSMDKALRKILSFAGPFFIKESLGIAEALEGVSRYRELID